MACPSRSARRKKAKRRWLRELANAGKKENTIEWNGTTSKKTGKKWGMEKNFKWTGSGKHDSDGGCNAEVVPEVGGMLAQDPVDYEKLMPLSGFPEEGDVIAYRLVELSSSWCPELSSFRVGKVSFFDAVSQKITLATVHGYPISSEEKNDGEEMTQFQSMYNEDGSLEADFTSLVNVRIMERSNKVARVGGGSDDAALVGKKGQASCSSTNGQANDTLFPARRPQTDWDEICQALDEKKAQLLKKDSWNTKQASTSGGGGRGSWSYKAVRGCSLGPTIALLRSKNDI
ncbi:hypothetical protein QJS04_geneDACA024151 [Acorus gramineus]|uniref:Coilin tudor domain-containing protein n=1 Tax=Acorus gramineus TaxID=55184 RepID=A0AAV9A1V0_ACOGR|nr:hypothetical protein QJS04_geneDACA024151 [Acorus gramineus]